MEDMELPMPITTLAMSKDVVIIGGGIIGTACADALSGEGMHVVVLERLGLAAGASSACQSGVGFGVSMDDYTLRLHLAAVAAYQNFTADGTEVDLVVLVDVLYCVRDLRERYVLRYRRVEIGVCKGVFSQKVLSKWDCKKYYLVDLWDSELVENNNYKEPWAKDNSEHKQNYETTLENVKNYIDKIEIIRNYSHLAANDFEHEFSERKQNRVKFC